MDITRGRELQERIGLDALTLLVLFGDSISTEMHERSIRMVGKTWGIPDAETQEWLDAIAKEHSLPASVYVLWNFTLKLAVIKEVIN